MLFRSTRAASIGIAALLIMTLGIGDIRPLPEIFLYSLEILLGGLWYIALSLSLHRIMPYLQARMNLGECLIEIADFMRIKAEFYKEGMDYEANYKKLIEAQITVNEKIDAVREQLFKSREIVGESTQEGRFLLVIFVDMVDLYEQIMSTFYNYQNLHKQFDNTGILTDFENTLNLLAEQIEEIGASLKDGTNPNLLLKIPRKIKDLKLEIEVLTELKENENSTVIFSNIGLQALKNIEVNVENIYLRIKKRSEERRVGKEC